MTYKWTIPEVDQVEMPMIHVLLGQIGETPPQDFLANAQLKAQVERAKQEQRSSLAGLPIVKGKVKRRNDGS